MSSIDLDDCLRRFYAEARTKSGEEYSRSSLLGFRNSIERHFIANNRCIKLTNNPVFARSNKMLESKLKAIRRENKECTKHKPVIESQDILKLKTSPFMSPETPDGLLRKVWLYVTIYWCRRGCEGQRLLRRNSFVFDRDSDGKAFIQMSHEEQSKNHQGGFNDKISTERETRLYSTDEDGDAFYCIELYLSKLNPLQEAFFQKPRSNFEHSDDIWYQNKPLGVNRLSKLMKEISLGAGLSKMYTNHCVRATAITLLSDAGVPARHIMRISGHANEQSLASSNRRPSTSQLQNCSEIISHALEKGKTPTSCKTSLQAQQVPLASTLSEFSPSVVASNASLNSMFNSCNIGQVKVFISPANPKEL
ncbi:uncharacterized protein LOC116307592 [Actinia tenebrosa]|uniref:Uncharacterized protein LOC116307592 n=1 Tax=Actinia tenebrosa TaxID=6105 RepID=A0A6P8JA71_ACTTE|nr:uncharacterized protein LOC116307592 [Actinia tenebrosa]